LVPALASTPGVAEKIAIGEQEFHGEIFCDSSFRAGSVIAQIFKTRCSTIIGGECPPKKVGAMVCKKLAFEVAAALIQL